jgi:hypothetical protein
MTDHPYVLLLILFVCGMLLKLSMSIFPTWEARVIKAVGNFIVSLGVVMAWAMWMIVAYVILALSGPFLDN